MSEGPYLYDEGPAPLHTGSARRRHALIIGILLATVLVAVGMAVSLPLVKGSAASQSRDAVTVFLAALHQGDTDTAYQLLCDAERARLTPGEVAEEYLRTPSGSVAGTADGDLHGTPAERVTVRWDDGSRSTVLVVNESGARICGTTTTG